MIGLEVPYPSKAKATKDKKRAMMVPYQIIPSKKGSLPTGVQIGNSGSRPKAPYLPMIDRQTMLSVKAIRTVKNEKSIRMLNAFLERVLILNLRDSSVLVYTGRKKGKTYV